MSSALDSIDVAQDTPKFLTAALQLVHTAVGKKSQAPDAFRPLGSEWNKIANGLVRLSPAAAVTAGSEWSALVQFVAESSAHASNAQGAAAAVSAQAQAILRIDPTGGTLTTHHLDLVRTSLAAGAYSEARLVLDKEIHSFPSTEASDDTTLSNGYMTIKSGLTEALTIHAVQEYYLLGAMVYIGLREWGRAHHLLESVLCVPTQQSANGLMLEAYKKWALVSVLWRESSSLHAPRAANTAAIKNVRALSMQYEALAEAFLSKDPRKLQAELMEAADEFRQAGNYGLALNVVYRQRQVAVEKLARTFTTVPIRLVAEKLDTSSAEAASYVQQLVQEGQFSGRLEQAGEHMVVRFDKAGRQAATQADEVRVRTELMLQTRRIQELADHVREADRRLALTREYTEHTKRQRQQRQSKGDAAGSSSGGGGAGGGGSGSGAVGAGDDEDQMDVSLAGPQSDDEDESEMADVR